MFFKKIALGIIMMGIAAGFLMQPVSADAKTEELRENVISYIDIERTDTKPVTKSSVKKSVKKVKKVKQYKKSELRLMASIISCEAEGESFQGQVAVGIVVMNRVKSEAFPNTIRKVIYQKGQFSPVHNGMLKKKLAQYDAGKTKDAAWQSCIKAAKKALDGENTVKVKGKTKSMKGVRFFSVSLSGAKFRLGGHRFK